MVCHEKFLFNGSFFILISLLRQFQENLLDSDQLVSVIMSPSSEAFLTSILKLLHIKLISQVNLYNKQQSEISKYEVGVDTWPTDELTDNLAVQVQTSPKQEIFLYI